MSFFPSGITVWDKGACMCAHTHMNENYSLKGLKFISEKTKLALRSSWTCHASAFQFLLTCCPSQTLRNASVWEALEGARGLRLLPSPPCGSTDLISREIWTSLVGDIHKEPPGTIPRNLELCFLKYVLRFPLPGAR